MHKLISLTMKGIILSDKLPYFFTLLATLIAYQINNLVNIETNAPTLVYCFKEVSQFKLNSEVINKRIECSLKNISTNVLMKDLEVQIKFRYDMENILPMPYKVFHPDIISISPSALLGKNIIDIGSGDSIMVSYRIPAIQPNCSYILEFETIQNKQIKEYPKIYISSSSNAVRLVNRVDKSLIIFFVENQFVLNLILLCVWLVTFCIYIYLIGKYSLM